MVQGTENALAAHRGKNGGQNTKKIPSKIPGGGEVVDLMQYCSAEVELPLERHFDIMRNELDLKMRGSGDEYSSEKSREESTSNTSTDNAATTSQNDSAYRPLPTRKPNRESSLFEAESIGRIEVNSQKDDISTKKSRSFSSNTSDEGTKEGEEVEEKSNKPTFHPALKAAVFAEGQEAMWHEDEYSTVSSIIVKPKQAKKTDNKSASSKLSSKPLIPFFHRNKNPSNEDINEEESDQQKLPLDPIKIHVKRKKVKKSVVLLPQENNPSGAQTLVEANTHQEAVDNMIKARQLLNAALVLDGTPRLEDSEKMARFAFAHAAAARRFVGTKSAESRNDDDEPNLDDVLSYLAEQGQEAVYQHQKIIFSNSSDEDYDSNDENEDQENNSPGSSPTEYSIEAKNVKNKKGKRGLGLTEYAARAVHYLESILPNNIGETSKDAGVMITNALSADDFWSEAGISTLGMKNDTFEYGFSCGHPAFHRNAAAGDRSGKLNMDLMSLSSLNEILDGPFEEEKEELEVAEPSDQKDRSKAAIEISVIDIPNRPPSTKNRKKMRNQPKRNGILGLISPSGRKPLKKNSQKDKVSQAKDIPNVNRPSEREGSVRMTFSGQNGEKHADFKLRNQVRILNNRPSVDEENVYGTEIEYDAKSSQACFDGGLNSSKGPIRQNEGTKTTTDTENGLQLNLTKSASSQANDSLAKDRYNPSIGMPSLHLSTSESVEEQDICDEVDEWDEMVYRRNLTELQESASADSAGEPMAGLKSSRSVNDQLGDEHSDWTENDHTIDCEATSHSSRGLPRHVEPMGKTPKRDGAYIEESSSRHSREVSEILDFDRGEMHPQVLHGNVKKQRDSKSHAKNNSQSELAAGNSVHVDSNRHSKNLNQAVKKDGTLEDMSATTRSESGKSFGSKKSDGSKTKIFGRIVDMLGHKRSPLVPTAVIEETYIANKKTHKAISNSNIKAVETNGITRVPATTKRDNDQQKAQKKYADKKLKSALEAGAKQTEKPKEKHQKKKQDYPSKDISHNTKVQKQTMSSVRTVYDDSTTVIERAVSNGNLKALQSNEEGDETPPNYLALMLRKRAKEQEKNRNEATDEENSRKSEQVEPDADSFVAAIRGPRHQECPGVALDDVANRNPSRDPSSFDEEGRSSMDKYEIRNNLAPTPRRPERVRSIEEINPANDHDPPLDDASERQRMITARLYAAGSLSYDEDGSIKKEAIEKVLSDNPMIEMVPTVESAESYEDDSTNNGSGLNRDNDGPEIEVNVTPADKMLSPSRKPRLAFLPAILKHKN